MAKSEKVFDFKLFLLFNIPTIVLLCLTGLFLGKGSSWGIEINDNTFTATQLGLLTLLIAVYELKQGWDKYWAFVAEHGLE